MPEVVAKVDGKTRDLVTPYLTLKQTLFLQKVGIIWSNIPTIGNFSWNLMLARAIGLGLPIYTNQNSKAMLVE